MTGLNFKLTMTNDISPYQIDIDFIFYSNKSGPEYVHALKLFAVTTSLGLAIYGLMAKHSPCLLLYGPPGKEWFLYWVENESKEEEYSITHKNLMKFKF